MMPKEQRRALMLRWSVITAVAIALYWVVWYVVYGYMPVVTESQIWHEHIGTYPFGIPRWCDFLIGPICTVSAIWIIDIINRFDVIDEGDSTRTVLIKCAFMAGTFGLMGFSGGIIIAGFSEGLISGFIFGLIVGLGCFLCVGAFMFGIVAIAVICKRIGRLIANSFMPSFVSGIVASYRWSGFRRLGRWLVAADRKPQS